MASPKATTSEHEAEAYLAMYVFRLIRNDRKRQRVLRYGEDDAKEAQIVLDALHIWLDRAPAHHALRRDVLYLLRAVCHNTNRFPKKLLVEDGLVHGSMYTRTAESDLFEGLLGGVKVAIKRVLVKESSRKYFLREVITWAHLRHPHILPLIGVCIIEGSAKSRQLAMISRWMENGTLQAYVNGGSYTPGSRMRLGKEIAQGLGYLHANKIVHGDVKDTNILIGRDNQALLADFGLTLVGDITQGAYTSTSARGSQAWMAPERFGSPRGNAAPRRTPEMDVYAYGCLCYMLCTGRPIFDGEDMNMVVQRVLANERPHLPNASLDGTSVEPSFLWLMQKCWHAEASKRITMLHALVYFNIDLSEVLDGALRLHVTACRDFSAPKDDTRYISFKTGTRLEVTSCREALWAARTDSGMFGYFPHDALDPYITITVLFMAVATDAYEPEPSSDSSSPPILSLAADEWLEIIHLNKSFWLARRSRGPRDIGLIPAKQVRPRWPNVRALGGRLTESVFPYHSKSAHQLSFPQKTDILVWSHHDADLWGIGKVMKDGKPITGVLPMHTVR